MADAWTVPINTAGFNDLNDTIAKGHDLSWIGNLPDAFWKGQDQKYTQNNRDAFQNGLPKDENGNIDWSAVTEKLAKVGGTSQLSNILPLQKFDLARSMLQGDNSQPSTAQFPPSASRPSGTVQPQQQSQAQPQSDADIPTARPSPPGQNLTGPESTITGVDYGPVQTNGPNPVQTVSYTPSNPQGDQAAPQAQPAAPPQNFAQRFAPATQGGAPQAQPQSTQPPPTVAGPQGNINEATASRYEAIAAQAFRKSQAAALVDPAMSAAYKAQAESAAKQAEIIRGALAKNAETTPEIKNTGAAGLNNPIQYDQASGFAKKTGENYAAQYQTIRKNAADAAVEKPQLDLVKQEMSDPNFYSGTAEGLNLAYKKALVALGGDPNAAQPQEALRKIVSNSILSQIRSMAGTGQIRVAEIKIMQKAVANPDTSPAANRLLVELSSRLSDRSLALDQLARGYNGGKIDQGFDNQVASYDKQHPIFSSAELKDPRLIAPPIFRSPADVQRANLPPGSPFQTPDGRTKYIP